MPVEDNDDVQENETFFVAGPGSEIMGLELRLRMI